MDAREAMALIGGAVPGPGGTWLDLGAGRGTFTRALAALLGPAGRVYAVDRDRAAVAAMRAWASRRARDEALIVPVEADFTRPLDGTAFGDAPADGLLLANALHFVSDQAAVLDRLVRLLAPGGRVALVEYDRRPASRWVPYPIPSSALPELFARAGLSEPTVVATRPSAYGGVIYAAAGTRQSGGAGGGIRGHPVSAPTGRPPR